MNKSESLTWSPPLSPVGILSSVAILRLPANFASYPRVGTDTPPQVLALGEQPSPITSLRSLSALTTENLRVCACVCVCVCVYRKLEGRHRPVPPYSPALHSPTPSVFWLG